MAEIRPVINPVQVKDRMGSTPKQTQGEPFNISGDITTRVAAVKQGAEGKNGAEEQKNALLTEMSRQILKPIQEKTDIQASELKELLNAAKILDINGEKVSQELLDKLFINPAELLKALIQREKGETSFQGEVFDILRMLANIKVGKAVANSGIATTTFAENNVSNQGNPAAQSDNSISALHTEISQSMAAKGEGTAPKVINASINEIFLSTDTKTSQLQNAVVNVLRHFDCYVNQENSLKAILPQLTEVKSRVSTQDAGILQQYIGRLEELIKNINKGSIEGKNSGSPYAQFNSQMKTTDVMQTDSGKIDEAQRFLKNQLIPILSKVVNKYQQAPVVREPIAAIIHYVSRFDKASPEKMNQAINELNNILTDTTAITPKDAAELKELLFEAARGIRQEQQMAAMEKEFLSSFGVSTEESDMLTLISKNLGDNQPPRLQKLALNLLSTLVDNQSPVMPIMHYMIPVKWGDYDTFLEMYVKKGQGKSQDREGAKGSSSEVNIFFTIQSDAHGTFEVDLLAKNKFIELDIKAPADLQREVKSIRGKINEGLGELGYKLAGYKVGVYVASKNAGDKFPELKTQKLGIDIKI